jgi:hypothetical protein
MTRGACFRCGAGAGAPQRMITFRHYDLARDET